MIAVEEIIGSRIKDMLNKEGFIKRIYQWPLMIGLTFFGFSLFSLTRHNIDWWLTFRITFISMILLFFSWYIYKRTNDD